jgi:predicted nucleic acid-binding protein
MTLSEIPSTTEIFIDANIFVYHFSGPTELTPACSAFLRRIEDGDLSGYTSLIAVAEALHRLMIIEPTEALQVEARQAVRYLKEHPTAVSTLTGHLVVPERIQAMGVHILIPTVEDLLLSQEQKLTFGFLTNDAINLTVMKRHRLRHIATNDPDFQRVESLKVWKPSPPSPAAANSV